MEGEITNKFNDDENNTWEAYNVQTEQVIMQDPGVGKGIIVRHFFFKSPPRDKTMKPPSKQEVISWYKRMIEDFLWKDGLLALPDRVPQLYRKKELKRGPLRSKMLDEGADFVIMVLCEKRFSQNMFDKAMNLNSPI